MANHSIPHSNPSKPRNKICRDIERVNSNKSALTDSESAVEEAASGSLTIVTARDSTMEAVWMEELVEDERRHSRSSLRGFLNVARTN
ncbi:hypothetical protein FCV25MIE_20536 [Fagus crenata]